jgi:hypothetical protein
MYYTINHVSFTKGRILDLHHLVFRGMPLQGIGARFSRIRRETKARKELCFAPAVAVGRRKQIVHNL